MPDDWVLDAWEDAAFDADVWDARQAEDEGLTLREPHPTLSPSWKKHSAIDYAQKELGAAFSYEKCWELVEADGKYDAITYGLLVDAGNIETTLHHLVEELGTTIRAFGTRLETTNLHLGQPELEFFKAAAAALEQARPRKSNGVRAEFE